MFRSAFATALMASLAFAQNDHRVAVGLNGLTFSPNQLTGVAISDTVTFEFHPKAHSVTQSSFTTPCVQLINTTTNQSGFDSGFVPVDANATSFPTYTLRVTVDTPIWIYCRQGDHCQQGMVFAINPTANKTFAAFQAAAMAGGGAANASAASAPAAGATSGSSGGSGGYGYGGSTGGSSTSAADASASGSTGSTSSGSSSGAGRTVVSSGIALLGAVSAAVFVL